MKTINVLTIVCFTSFLFGCSKDLGNYDYKEKNEITITNIPELIEVLGNSDKIVISPTITSKADGVITEDNPNYEYKYQLEYYSGGRVNSGTPNSGSWLLFNPRGNKDLDTIANLNPNTYLLWFTVTDKRTGIGTSTSSMVKVTSSTYEGWFVLCEEGTTARVRMDFISKLSSDRYIPTYDIFTSRNFPDISKAYGVIFHPSIYASPGDRVLVMTGQGTYIPNAQTFMFNQNIAISNLKYSDFLQGKYPDDHPVCLTYSTSYGSGYNLFVSNKGNAFCLDGSYSGPIYQDPINTTVRSTSPQYKLAPFIGINEYRSSVRKAVRSAIFYDKDNKRFIGWSSQTSASSQITTPLQDPPANEKIFSYTTGMELIHMENTRFSGGVTFAVMKDAMGNRHIYGLNYPSTYSIGQHSLVTNVNAPEFGVANNFAFSSQYAYTYYAVNNKVYSFDRGTNTTKVVLTLPANEEVTIMKFLLAQNDFNVLPQPVLDGQYNLVVCSFDKTKEKTGGTVRILEVNGTSNSLTQVKEWSGFAKIIDIAYRERR